MKKLLLAMSFLLITFNCFAIAVNEDQVLYGKDCYIYRSNQYVNTLEIDGAEEPYLRYGEDYINNQDVYSVWVGDFNARTNIAFCSQVTIEEK